MSSGVCVTDVSSPVRLGRKCTVNAHCPLCCAFSIESAEDWWYSVHRGVQPTNTWNGQP